MSETGDLVWRSAWHSLWRSLNALANYARRLRQLSQVEPLLQARPDYPRPRSTASHADELRRVFQGLREDLRTVEESLLAVLADREVPGGTAPDETPRAIKARLGALARLLETLEKEAFQPPPPLPKHGPPYLAEAPAHDLAGSKAVLLSYGIEEAVAALRNALLGVLNADAMPPVGPPPRSEA
jgi:hypothetical protein